MPRRRPDSDIRPRAVLDPPLPAPNDYVITAIADWLHGKANPTPSQRVPLKTATVLSFICQLYEKNRELPTRPVIMQHLDVTESLIDLTLSQRTAEGLIHSRYEEEEGKVKKRLSTVRRRYVEPSEELLKVYLAAVRRDRAEKNALRRRRENKGEIIPAAIIGALVTGVGWTSVHQCLEMLLGLTCHFKNFI